MSTYSINQLCEAMEKLSLSNSYLKYNKKNKSLIKCWKCSELGHIKRFCKSDFKYKNRRSKKKKISENSKEQKDMMKFNSFKLTFSKL